MMIPFLDKFKNKFPKEIFSVGLDIGSSTIKAVKLRFFSETVELNAVDLEPVGDNIESTLKKIIELEKIDKANIAISGPNTVIRNIDFPKMQKDELAQALKFEAQKHIPFSIDQVNIDAYILRNDLPENKMKVLIAAAKKDFINQRVKFMESVGIKPNIIDIDSIALINAFNNSKVNNAEHKAAALLNIGALQTNLSIIEEGSPVLSRDIHIAGNNFTKVIADSFGLDLKAAEELKINPAEEKKEKISQVVESVSAGLVNEIRISFDYYESQSASSVAKIFICGGGSLLYCLKGSLAGMLDMEVEYWDSLKSIVIPENMAQKNIKALSPQLAVAVGLALRK